MPTSMDERRLGRSCPVDIFILSEGESEQRSATKIGGLPYRSASEQWPTTDSGKPMALLAQFNFTDSKDLVGENTLQGDLLLVFGDDEYGVEPLHLEWQNVTNLELVASIPNDAMCIPPCFGTRFRTGCWPNATPRQAWLDSAEYEDIRIIDVMKLLCNDALQIGRAPYIIDEMTCTPKSPWVHLCTIPSVIPQSSVYPFLNRKTQPDHNIEEYLMIHDGGCIYIVMNLETLEVNAFGA